MDDHISKKRKLSNHGIAGETVTKSVSDTGVSDTKLRALVSDDEKAQSSNNTSDILNNGEHNSISGLNGDGVLQVDGQNQTLSRKGSQEPSFATESNTEPPLSKSQQKKLRKKQEWESRREERKVVRKQKQVEKRDRKKAARDEALQQIADQNGGTIPPNITLFPKRPKAVQLPITVLIDCAFDDLMRDGERISLASQLTRCYSDTRQARYRTHMGVCAFTGKLRERFDNVLSHYHGWRGVQFVEGDFVAAAEETRSWMQGPKGGVLSGPFEPRDIEPEELDAHKAKLQQEGEIVYLSSDATEILHTLRPYSTYIIGGLVDKNREKGVCHERAVARGVRTAQLPIGEFLELQSRKVLTTNHVNEILLRYLACGDWGEAFMQVIPKRKGRKLRGNEDGNAEKSEETKNDSEQDDDEDTIENVAEVNGELLDGADESDEEKVAES